MRRGRRLDERSTRELVIGFVVLPILGGCGLLVLAVQIAIWPAPELSLLAWLTQVFFSGFLGAGLVTTLPTVAWQEFRRRRTGPQEPPPPCVRETLASWRPKGNIGVPAQISGDRHADLGETMRVDRLARCLGMDIRGAEGPNKGKEIQAIYEFDGTTLKICYDLSGKARPTEFQSTAANQQLLVVYRREKK